MSSEPSLLLRPVHVNPSIHYGPERREWKDTVSRYAVNPAYNPERDLPERQFLVKPPYNDPVIAYPAVFGAIGDTPEAFHAKYQVPSRGLLKPQIDDANALALERNKTMQENFIGYQVDPFFDYSNLKEFLKMHSNNVGDPFAESRLQTNTRWIERNVLDYYASLWNIDWPHSRKVEESYWGYSLTMGSTEGNMYALWTARDYVTGKELVIDLKDKSGDGAHSCYMVQAELKNKSKQKNKNIEIPVLFYSEDAHYSLMKTSVLEQIRTFQQVGNDMYPDMCPVTDDKKWPDEVPSTAGPFGPGSVDIKKLTTLVTFFTDHGHPAIVVLNYGTTFKGAYDDVEAAGTAIEHYLIQQGEGGLYNEFEITFENEPPKTFQRRKVWIHVDGALGASYMPFLEMALKHGKATLQDLIPDPAPQVVLPKILPSFPVFDFRLSFVCSIATSGHKWMGAPWPCGVFMTRSKLVLMPPAQPDYIGVPDTTFAGSRNGLSPLILWNFISTHSFDSQVQAILQCLSRLRHISNELKKLESTYGQLWVEMTPLALTLRFKRPRDEILNKYSMGTEEVTNEKGEKRDYAHLFVMQSTTEWQMEEFLWDMKNSDPYGPHYIIERTRNPRPNLKKLSKCTSKRLVFWPLSGRGYH